MNPNNSRDMKLIWQVAAGILLAFSILWIAFMFSAASLRPSLTVMEGPVAVRPDPQPLPPDQ